MPARQPIPRRWLMTDERLGDDLWRALRRLPPGSGIVFRHYHTPPTTRRALYRRVARVAVARRLVLMRAGAPTGGISHGLHAHFTNSVATTASVHDRRQALRAHAAGVSVLFVSPVHATASHPDGVPLGVSAARMIGARLRLPLIALGGMTERRFRRLNGFHGWAAIDAWRQKRKAVPT